MSNDFFGYTSAIPRPPENPAIAEERERVYQAALARGQRETEATLARARELRAAIEENKERIRQDAIAKSTEAYKAEKRAGYRAAGMTDSEFERKWPALLAQWQDEIANSDPLAAEKARIKAQSNYSM